MVYFVLVNFILPLLSTNASFIFVRAPVFAVAKKGHPQGVPLRGRPNIRLVELLHREVGRLRVCGSDGTGGELGDHLHVFGERHADFLRPQ